MRILPSEQHNDLLLRAYRHRGFTTEESQHAVHYCHKAAWYGIRTHNGIKALHLDDHFGSRGDGCVPGAKMERIPSRFSASEIWNANRKLGQAVAAEAMSTAISLADQYGIAQVSVDNAFHYLWGGGYVMEAAEKGYIAYTNCTAALAEVVPFRGKFPTLGTNPHSWGFPTTDAIGFPVVIDWATSVVAMGRVQQLAREGKALPPDAAVDASGSPTTDPASVSALLPFGAHKGYGLSLINEIVAAFIGGSLPTIRSRTIPEGEKRTPCFYFMVVHPEALDGNCFASGRNQVENVKAVIDDILGHGNDRSILPGQMEADNGARSKAAGGLLFSEAEIDALNEIAAECGAPLIDTTALKKFE